jgi:hypothetical protein
MPSTRRRRTARRHNKRYYPRPHSRVRQVVTVTVVAVIGIAAAVLVVIALIVA